MQIILNKNITKELSIEMDQGLAEELHNFWFGELTDRYPTERHDLWFSLQSKAKHPEFDQLIREKYSSLIFEVMAGQYDSWKDTPRSRLALILILDQFPRNSFRGTSQAFDFDARAREIVKEGLANGDDQALLPVEKEFFYLPLIHSENLDDQKLAELLAEQLVEESNAETRPILEKYLYNARRHLTAIELFGRFPHRNEALGRASTPEEIEALQNPLFQF